MSSESVSEGELFRLELEGSRDSAALSFRGIMKPVDEEAREVFRKEEVDYWIDGLGLGWLYRIVASGRWKAKRFAIRCKRWKEETTLSAEEKVTKFRTCLFVLKDGRHAHLYATSHRRPGDSYALQLAVKLERK